MAYHHTPVLLQEVIRGLNPQPGQHFVDGTVGGGGHAWALLEATAPDGRLVAFDRDAAALASAQRKLEPFSHRLTFIHDSYSQLATYVRRANLPRLDGVLLDLGLSSAQLADSTRGFSFQSAGALDLRFDTSQGVSAAELLNTASSEELEQIWRNLGQEPQARALARAIVARRRQRPLATTGDLLEVVTMVKGSGQRRHHPATLVWQALRLAVNHELTELASGLKAAVEVLGEGGRLAVISFHSGEDRLVKDFFRRESRTCLCPPELPVCRCHHQPTLKVLTTKPIIPNSAEILRNPRARSAKLRLAQKINR
ncbi:MAG: 16S rRNA (cytosine(1402)-N(4))-methyltransferase RsmH [Candidatus Kerfeldbacteria bacterium]|nr:16S rRNA (cytosine(1402)-N(4))-methyltransferase RsmH [Candidatus Kerfeldbacteria bacterium]